VLRVLERCTFSVLNQKKFRFLTLSKESLYFSSVAFQSKITVYRASIFIHAQDYHRQNHEGALLAQYASVCRAASELYTVFPQLPPQG